MDGELWANVYQTDLVARIDPASGRVRGWVDLVGLLTPAERAAVGARRGVANGLALDSALGRVLVTGKLWPRLFEITLESTLWWPVPGQPVTSDESLHPTGGLVWQRCAPHRV